MASVAHRPPHVERTWRAPSHDSPRRLRRLSREPSSHKLNPRESAKRIFISRTRNSSLFHHFSWTAGQPYDLIPHLPAMLSPFHIFRVQIDGSRRWMEGAVSLESAKTRVRVLAASSPGEYVITNLTGQKIWVKSQLSGSYFRWATPKEN